MYSFLVNKPYGGVRTKSLYPKISVKSTVNPLIFPCIKTKFTNIKFFVGDIALMPAVRKKGEPKQRYPPGSETKTISPRPSGRGAELLLFHAFAFSVILTNSGSFLISSKSLSSSFFSRAALKSMPSRYKLKNTSRRSGVVGFFPYPNLTVSVIS